MNKDLRNHEVKLNLK